MKIEIKQKYHITDVNRAAQMTTHGGVIKAPLRFWFKSRHSPIRMVKYWVELLGIPSFVSVHLVRHKVGVEHFVQSMRDDRGGAGDDVVNRLTPVNHSMDLNAETIITMAEKRLCYKSHHKTVGVFRKLRAAIGQHDHDLARWMVPRCVTIGYCPEAKECKPGVLNVLHAYRDCGPMVERERVRQRLEGTE